MSVRIDTEHLFVALSLVATAVVTIAPGAPIAVLLIAGVVAVAGVKIDGIRVRTRRNRSVLSLTWIAVGIICMIGGAAAVIQGIAISKRDPFDWKISLPGHTDLRGALYIHAIQVTGAHRETRPIELSRATVRSDVTGQEVPLELILPNESPISPSESNPVPTGAQVELQTLLYDPAKVETGAENGMPVGDFLRDWSSFTLLLTLNGKDFEHPFDDAWVKNQVAQMNPERSAAPRVTKRQ